MAKTKQTKPSSSFIKTDATIQTTDATRKYTPGRAKAMAKQITVGKRKRNDFRLGGK